MMNKDKCTSLSFNNFVDNLFIKMDNRLKFIWLCFLATTICLFIYEIFKPSIFVFSVIVYGFFLSILNIGDYIPSSIRDYLNYFNTFLIVSSLFYIIFKPMINVFFDNTRIFSNMVYIWIIVILYIIATARLVYLCKTDTSSCSNYLVPTFIVITIITLFIFMIFNLLSTITNTKEGMDNVNAILPIPIAPADYNYSLSSYYVMTASDCCLDPSNTTVSIDALKNTISKGARCLDFQIFSVNNTPVVSYSSSNDNFYFVNVRNTIPFSDVMRTIATYAFQDSTCSNFSDPLFIHLRVKSNNEGMFPALANIFSTYVAYMLNSQYNYTSMDPINIPGMALPSLRNKIIIVMDNNFQSVLKYKPIIEYVNIISNKSFCQTMTYTEYKNTPDITQLIDFNKTSLSIVLPDTTPTINPNPMSVPLSEANPGGVQMAGISFQNNDPNDISFFTDAKYAFVLKPEELRSTPPPSYERTEQPIDPIPVTTTVQGGLSITL